MDRVDLEDVDSWMGPAAVKRPVGRSLGTEHAAINYYELDPGESFAFGYHRHADQEEMFYVLAGEATFETDDGEVAVGEGELVRFGPGEWQRGWNRGEQRVRALAVGAPADAGETTILRDCADCGARTGQRVEATDDGDALVTRCVDCEAVTGRFD